MCEVNACVCALMGACVCAYVRACLFVNVRAQACYDAWEKRVYRTYKYLQT